MMNDVEDRTIDDFWQLQKNQQAIGWDNLLRGKFSKDWRKLQHTYRQKKKNIYRQTKQQQKRQEDNNVNPEIRVDMTMKKKTKKPTKYKADVLQRVFESITTTVQGLWLRRNTDQYNLI